MKSVVVDGVPIQLDDVGAAVISKLVDEGMANKKKMSKAKADEEDKEKEWNGEMDGVKKQLDAANGKIAVLTKQVEDAKLSPEKVGGLVKDGAEIIGRASTILDSNSYAFSGKSAEDIRRATVTSKLGDAVTKNMNDGAIEGAFVALTADNNNGGTRQLGDSIGRFEMSGHRPGGSPQSIKDAAHADYVKGLTNAWKTPTK